MCLLVFAWSAVPGTRLVLAGNRDEFHARPAAPMQWWTAPRMLAGRDLQAGGTWLGAGEDGRFAVVTNFRAPTAPAAGAPSRGELIPAYFAGRERPLAFLQRLAEDGARYAGFSLLVGDAGELAWWSNRADHGPARLEAGVYGLSNALLDTPWPKLTRTRARFAQLLAAGAPPLDGLLDVMTDRAPAAAGDLPDTGVGAERERFLSPAFIVGAAYGTRCTTALAIDEDGRLHAAERSYDAAGRALDTRRIEHGARAA
jgi:uncharacterized protein with NRDE domain